jgi:hypothetical protein
MKIAFDLDGTLIRSDFDFELETPKHHFLSKILKYEKLRLGTPAIFDFCKKNGCETWVYTSSYRNTFYIRTVFWLYGIRLDGVINGQMHTENVKKSVSKYPPAFGIDVLVDDSEGVKIEGERHNFKVIWLKPNDGNWVETVKNKLQI